MSMARAYDGPTIACILGTPVRHLVYSVRAGIRERVAIDCVRPSPRSEEWRPRPVFRARTVSRRRLARPRMHKHEQGHRHRGSRLPPSERKPMRLCARERPPKIRWNGSCPTRSLTNPEGQHGEGSHLIPLGQPHGKPPVGARDLAGVAQDPAPKDLQRRVLTSQA